MHVLYTSLRKSALRKLAAYPGGYGHRSIKSCTHTKTVMFHCISNGSTPSEMNHVKKNMKEK